MTTNDSSARSPSRPSARVVAACVAAAIVAVVVLAIDGTKLGEFLGVGMSGLLVAVGAVLVATLARIVRGPAAFGTSRVDRILVVGVLAIGGVLAVADFVRVEQALPGPNALPLLRTTALLVVEGLAVALAVEGLGERGGLPARASALVARVLFASLLVTLVLVALEGWAVTHFVDNWYAIVPLDGGRTPFQQSDPVVRWRLRPHFKGRLIHPELGDDLVATNSIGLRDREPDAGARPAILLGDSFAFGLGIAVEDALARRLEGLGAAPRVWNAGVPGFGTLDELVMLDRLSKIARPSLVVVLFYPGNDFQDNLDFLVREGNANRRDVLSALFPAALEMAERAATLVDASALALRSLEARSAGRLWLEQRSKLARLLFDAADRRAVKRGSSPKGPALTDSLARSLMRAGDPGIELAYRATSEGFRAIAARATTWDARTLVCFAPAQLQVDSAHFGQVMRDVGLDPSILDVDRPQTVLSADCAAAKIDFLDLTPDLRDRMARGERLYFSEGHWNAAGHAAMAQRIAAHLRRAAADRPPSDASPR